MRQLRLSWVDGPAARDQLALRLAQLGAVSDFEAALPLTKRTLRLIPPASLGDPTTTSPVGWLVPKVDAEVLAYVWDSTTTCFAQGGSALDVVGDLDMLLPSRRPRTFLGNLTDGAKISPVLTKMVLLAAKSSGQPLELGPESLSVPGYGFGRGWAHGPNGRVDLPDGPRPLQLTDMALPGDRTMCVGWGTLRNLGLHEDVDVRHLYRCLHKAYGKHALTTLQEALKVSPKDVVPATPRRQSTYDSSSVLEMLGADLVDLTKLGAALRDCGWTYRRVQVLFGALSNADGTPIVRQVRAKTRDRIMRELTEECA